MHLKLWLYILLLWVKYYIYISIKFIWSNMSFKAIVCLLIFYLNDLSTDVSGMLKSPIITDMPSLSLFMSVNIYSMYLSSLMLGAYIRTIVKYSFRIHTFIIIQCPFLSLLKVFALKSILYYIIIGQFWSFFFLVTVFFFLSFQFQPMYGHQSKVSFL